MCNIMETLFGICLEAYYTLMIVFFGCIMMYVYIYIYT